jgi:hypothetical protein
VIAAEMGLDIPSRIAKYGATKYIGYADRTMRAETQATIDEIKQSVGLLRRHL